MKIKITILSIFLLFLSCEIYAQWTPSSVPDPIKNGSFVANPDNLISQPTVDSLNYLIKRANDSAYIQIAVVVLNSIGDAIPKEFATNLFNLWKIGRQDKNDGLLILLVMDQKRVEFETGYGIEAVLTDAVCYQIQQDYMVPRFKDNDYDGGLLDGVRSVIYTISNDSAYAQQSYVIDENTDYPQPEYRGNNNAGKGFLFIFLFFSGIASLIYVIFLIIAFSQKDFYKRYQLIRPFTLIFLIVFVPIPFLPLYFVNKLLLDKWRNAPRMSRNGKIMKRLSEKEDDKYLQTGQVTEEEVKSIDYDVWLDEETGETLVLAYKRWFSKYSQCPKCKYKTYYMEYNMVITPATYTSSGKGERKYKCVNCGHTKIDTYTIPKKQQVSTTSGSYGGSSHWGGGSFGGGSFGGSWGGGSSGGGGAGSSW